MKALKLLFICLLTSGFANVAVASDAGAQGTHLGILTIDHSALATLNAWLGTSDGATVTKAADSGSASSNHGDSPGCDQPGNADSSATAHSDSVSNGSRGNDSSAGSGSSASGSSLRSQTPATTLSWQSLLPGSIQ